MTESPDFTAADITVVDDVLSPEEQSRVYRFLSKSSWAFGAYSDPSPEASRYWYKHFCGYVKDGAEKLDESGFEAELLRNAPVVHEVWKKLQAGLLRGHVLSRCYANGYPSGSEGGVHMDSNIATHFTTIYYPHAKWSPTFAGETVFFTKDGGDILRAVYPRPNRIVIFPGTIPHVARAVSRRFADLRITLMFKTAAVG